MIDTTLTEISELHNDSTYCEKPTNIRPVKSIYSVLLIKDNRPRLIQLVVYLAAIDSHTCYTIPYTEVFKAASCKQQQ